MSERWEGNKWENFVHLVERQINGIFTCFCIGSEVICEKKVFSVVRVFLLSFMRSLLIDVTCCAAWRVLSYFMNFWIMYMFLFGVLHPPCALVLCQQGSIIIFNRHTYKHTTRSTGMSPLRVLCPISSGYAVVCVCSFFLHLKKTKLYSILLLIKFATLFDDA